MLENVKSQRDRLLNNLITTHPIIVQFVENFKLSLAALKKALDDSHPDIQKHHGVDASTTLEKQEERILTKDIDKLKGTLLHSRYLILNWFNMFAYGDNYAKTKLIGEFTKADLVSDPAKLIDLFDKREICDYVKYTIDGENYLDVIKDIRTGMKTRVDSALDTLARQKLLNDDPVLLKSALLGFLGPITFDLADLVTKDNNFKEKLDVILEEMPDRKELANSAIFLQLALKDLPEASSSVKYAKALAEYIKCNDVRGFAISMPNNKKHFLSLSELVDQMNGLAEGVIFISAILEYDEASFERTMHDWMIHDFLKDSALDLIRTQVNGIHYAKHLFEKCVELLRKIVMKEPSSTTIIPKLGSNIQTSLEDAASASISSHFRIELRRALDDINNVRNFDDTRLENLIHICHFMNIKMFDANFSIFLLPIMAYLKDDTLSIDFTAETFDDHVPVRTFLNYWSLHPEMLFQSYNAVARDTFDGTASLNTGGILLHKLLVPTFDLLPSIDFYDLNATNVELFHDSLLDFGSIDGGNKAFKTACLEALTKDTNPNRIQNILYLWGSQKTPLVEQKRKQLESLKLAIISDEIVLRAQDRLLKKKAKVDADIKAIYKTHYEALKQLYSGADREAKFPNNW